MNNGYGSFDEDEAHQHNSINRFDENYSANNRNKF
jgi:hypothetical protein